ncbi:MAG: S-methyl-5-thioribose-1-phosphate isomerase [Lentisphaerae bacterium]|nr:S-methyl-5-thioribose-1-phosphate isomerase [Lentisphaerota bacterium]
MTTLRTIEWISESPPALIPGHVRLIDQTQLPETLAYLDTADVEVLREAIRMLRVRGAPAIGIAAAMGVAAAAQAVLPASREAVLAAADAAAARLAGARPTAVNLFWALERMQRLARTCDAPTAQALAERLAREACAVRDEDAAMCRAIGGHGLPLLRDGCTVLTHCNAGGLATAEFGTALAPVYAAAEQGLSVRVFADETRPLLQGSRLTAWELMQAGIPVTVITDGMAAQVMKEGRIDAVLVGADRIAANGDAANKIGTYGTAVLARHHRIPFYVLAPTSTIDLRTPGGDGIPIEERDREEVIRGFGRLTAPESVAVYSPAFDVTPAPLVTAIVCEKGIVRPPYEEALRLVAERRPRPIPPTTGAPPAR